jgi:phosphocarrier protein HPr
MEKIFKVLNEEGMHARPAGALVKVANEFQSKIDIEFNGTIKNAKSIMGIMSLGLEKDSEFKVIITGEDETQAMDKIGFLVKNKFQI